MKPEGVIRLHVPWKSSSLRSHRVVQTPTSLKAHRGTPPQLLKYPRCFALHRRSISGYHLCPTSNPIQNSPKCKPPKPAHLHLKAAQQQPKLPEQPQPLSSAPTPHKNDTYNGQKTSSTMKTWERKAVKVCHTTFQTSPQAFANKVNVVCCIYHAPHNAEASSGDDSSSDSSSDSDSGDDGAARPVGGKKNRRGRRGQKHPHDHDHGKGDGRSGDGNGKAKGTVRKRSPNAYEKQPTIKKKN